MPVTVGFTKPESFVYGRQVVNRFKEMPVYCGAEGDAVGVPS